MEDVSAVGEWFRSGRIKRADLKRTVEIYLSDGRDSLIQLGTSYFLDVGVEIDSNFASRKAWRGANSAISFKRTMVITTILLARTVIGSKIPLT